MSKLLIIISWIFFHACIGNIEQFDQSLIKTVKLGLSQTFQIEYKNETNFFFNIEDNYTYRVNIHSINCNFEIDFKGEIIKQINLDTYTLKLNRINNNITLKPLIDISEGKETENYNEKKCHLIINSMNEDKPEIEIENKEDTFFFFELKDSNSLNISYKIKEVTDDSFAALSFHFNEKCDFLIDIYNNNDGNPIIIKSKKIYNSTYIYLKSDIIKKNSDDNSELKLNIVIKKNDDNKAINMFFKIIEKEAISMLQKGAINYGFITTEINYQYFYFEVYNEEEGELMLHNKRFYGLLLAKIIPEEEINETDLYNSSIYPKDDTDSNILNYNPHSLKLQYSYKDTLNCTKGCFILVTYEQKKSEGNYPVIGYEFTILSRSWNYSDYISQIVDIPFNEYLIGSFEKDSIAHHYYSLSIPDEAETLIINMEGNYFDLFIGEGRKKINTMKIRENDKNLGIINNKNVITLDIKELNYKEKVISFTVRSKDYFANIFSFYILRIFYAKKNEVIYYPIDSQLGNLCSPKYNEETKLYYCNFMFSNQFDELSTSFAVSSPNQNEYFKIYVNKLYKNNNTKEEMAELYYRYSDNTNDIDKFFFTIEFRNGEIKNIISALQESIKYYNHHIYSSELFYIDSFNKTFLYRVKNNYILTYKHIFGRLWSNGIVDVSFLNYTSFYSNRNFRGRSFALDINPNTTKMNHRIPNGALLFVITLEYNMRNKGLIEIESGDTRSQIIESGYFPLYYYLKIKNENYINIDVTLRLNSFDNSVMKNNFEIKGYILDEETITRKINGEYIKLTEPIQGTYSNKFKIGLLEVNQEKKYKNNNYLLIEIENMDLTHINSYLLIEVLSKEHNQDIYFMPIGMYFFETFNDRNNTIRDKNKYHINANEKSGTHLALELSPEYDDIEIIFTNETHPEGFKCSDFDCYIRYATGFKKYFIGNIHDYNIYFNVINPNNRTANYMIRYYYGDELGGYSYEIKNLIEKKYIDFNDEYITLSITYDQVHIYYQNKPANPKYKTYFYISGLLYKKSENSQELLNTTSFLHEKERMYENKTINLYNVTNPENFTLVFKDISRNNNYIYDLQIQANVFIEDNIFNEEFLIFTKEIDLTDIKLEKEKSILWYILGPILGLVFLILVIFFAVKFIRLKNANLNLKEDLKSMAYSNDIQKNVIVKDQNEVARKDSDYENTFI